MARYDKNCFTAYIPSELMEFLEMMNIKIGEDNDAGFRLVDFLKQLNKLDPQIQNLIGFKTISPNEEVYQTSRTMLNALPN